MMVLFATIRALHFASLMAIFGASAYLALLRHRLRLELRTATCRLLFTCAATLAFVTALIWFGLVAGQMSGDWRGALDPQALHAVAFQTRFGTLFLIRAAGLTILWLLCIIGKQNVFPGAMAALLLGALALTSHAAASGPGFVVLRALNDATHLVAGGFWIGGLLVLIALLRKARAEPQTMIAPLRLFSFWGSVAVAALITSGIVNAVMIVPARAITTASPYVGLLTAKILVASVMIALAIVNRWTLAPALRTDPRKSGPALSRSISAELALGALVIAIVGYLGLTPPQ